MQTLTFINPLKSGMLEEYKQFSQTNLGAKRSEYIDLLKRYGLRDAKVYLHNVNGKDIVIVIHQAEDNALEKLATFGESTNPYDKWFLEQLNHLHGVVQNNQANLLFTIDTKTI